LQPHPPKSALTLVRPRDMDHDEALAWTGAVSAFDPEQAEVIKTTGERAVYRATLRDRDLTIKRWDMLSVPMLKLMTGSTQAHRQFKNAELLHKYAVNTYKPIALLVGKHQGIDRELLVLPWLEGETLLHHIAFGEIAIDPASRTSTAIATAVGHQIGNLDTLGRRNRDHKPSNLVVTRAGDERAVVEIIDTVAIQKKRDVPRMLADLIIEPEGVGAPTPEPFLRTVAWAIREATIDTLASAPDELLDQAQEIARSHGDATPKDNPFR